MNLDRSETTTTYIVVDVVGNILARFNTEAETRKAHELQPDTEMYRHHVMSFKERLDP